MKAAALVALMDAEKVAKRVGETAEMMAEMKAAELVALMVEKWAGSMGERKVAMMAV